MLALSLAQLSPHLFPLLSVTTKIDLYMQQALEYKFENETDPNHTLIFFIYGECDKSKSKINESFSKCSQKIM